MSAFFVPENEIFFITLPAFGKVELLFCVRKNSDDEKQHCSYCMSEISLYLRRNQAKRKAIIEAKTEK